MLLNESCQNISQIHIVDIHPRDVDRYVDAGIALPIPFLEQSADPLPDILVQLRDKAVALKDGDELSGRLQAPFRMVPPHECLCTCQLPIPNLVLWLQVDLKLSRSQCCFHTVRNGLPA